MSDAAREDAIRPDVIPFPGSEAPPKPVDCFHGYCLLKGMPVHLIGEWWRAEDAGASESPTFPDPTAPGLVFGIRAEFEGETSQTITRDEYRELSSGHAAGFQTRPQAGLQSY